MIPMHQQLPQPRAHYAVQTEQVTTIGTALGGAGHVVDVPVHAAASGGGALFTTGDSACGSVGIAGEAGVSSSTGVGCCSMGLERNGSQIVPPVMPATRSLAPLSRRLAVPRETRLTSLQFRVPTCPNQTP